MVLCIAKLLICWSTVQRKTLNGPIRCLSEKYMRPWELTLHRLSSWFAHPAKNQRRKFETNIRNCAVAVPISTFMCLWAIYIPRLICLSFCRKISGPILEKYKSLTDKWVWKLGLRPRNSQKRIFVAMHVKICNRDKSSQLKEVILDFLQIITSWAVNLISKE